MATLQRLNNVLPPTYDKVNPEANDSWTDSASAVRATNGDDTFHYSVDQRVQGDLMVRDLILLQNQRNLFEYFSLLGPTKVSLPSFVVPSGSVPVQVAQFEASGDVAVAQCRLTVAELYTELGDAADYQLQLVKASDLTTPVFDTHSDVVVPWVSTTAELSDAGRLIGAADTYVVLLVNASTEPVTMSGSLVVCTIVIAPS